MIVDPVTITINNSYDWNAWEKALIEKCIYDNPSSIFEELAPLLNISARTLFRKINKHKIDIETRKIHGVELYLKAKQLKPRNKQNVA